MNSFEHNCFLFTDHIIYITDKRMKGSVYLCKPYSSAITCICSDVNSKKKIKVKVLFLFQLKK